MSSWRVLDPSEITDEMRQALADLCEEERRERERRFWDVGLDPGYNGDSVIADYYGKDDLQEEDVEDIDSPIWNTYEDGEGEWYELNL